MKYDLDNYLLNAVIQGKGQSSVIIEGGFCDAVAELNSWKTVIEEVSKSTQTFIYDRLGLGSSDPINVAKRTIRDHVDDLYRLLEAANVEKPYILVGHSSGGLTVRLFAEQYPELVSGIVLIDASHPDQQIAFAKGIPPKSPDDSETLTMWKREFLSLPSSDNSEKLDFSASILQMQAIGDLGDLPLAVVSRNPKPPVETNCDALLGLLRTSESIWQDLQTDLTTLSTNSLHTVSDDAGHYVHQDDPQIVVDAILHILSSSQTKDV